MSIMPKETLIEDEFQTIDTSTIENLRNKIIKTTKPDRSPMRILTNTCEGIHFNHYKEYVNRSKLFNSEYKVKWFYDRLTINDALIAEEATGQLQEIVTPSDRRAHRLSKIQRTLTCPICRRTNVVLHKTTVPAKWECMLCIPNINSTFMFEPINKIV